MSLLITRQKKDRRRRPCARSLPSVTLIVEKRIQMFRDINILNLVAYCLYTNSVLANAALIFADLYTQDNRNMALTIFTLSIFVLVIGPTYYIAKTGWFKKSRNRMS